MKKPQNRIQRDTSEEKLYHFKIFILRTIGITLQEIGRELDKNHQTISYHLKRKNNTHRLCVKCAKNLQRYSEFILTQPTPVPPPPPSLPLRFCGICRTVLTRPTQTKFCGYKCSGIARTGKWWPKWITDFNGEKRNTGKSYKEYLDGTIKTVDSNKD